jgi:hypothetical protein
MEEFSYTKRSVQGEGNRIRSLFQLVASTFMVLVAADRACDSFRPRETEVRDLSYIKVGVGRVLVIADDTRIAGIRLSALALWP